MVHRRASRPSARRWRRPHAARRRARARRHRVARVRWASRTWLLRRAHGPAAHHADIVRHLSTFQRLGENVEVQAAGGDAPGRRPHRVPRPAHPRRRRSSAVDWVWPYWLERQLDPRRRAFVPRGHLPVPHQRHRTATGRPSATSARRGRRSSTRGAWSRRGSTGGRSTGGSAPTIGGTCRRARSACASAWSTTSPVVETAMRVPGGDAVHRAYGVPPTATSSSSSRSRTASPAAVRRRASRCGRTTPRASQSSSASSCTTTPSPSTAGRRCCCRSRRRGWRARRSTTATRPSIVMGGEAGRAFPRHLRVRRRAGAGGVPLPGAAPHRDPGRDAAVRRRAARGAAGLARRRGERAPDLPAPLPTRPTGGARAGTRSAAGACDSSCPTAAGVDASTPTARFLLLFHDGDEITPGPVHVPPVLVPRRRVHARARSTATASTARSAEVARPLSRTASTPTASSSASARSGTRTAPRCTPWPSTGGSPGDARRASMRRPSTRRVRWIERTRNRKRPAQGRRPARADAAERVGRAPRAARLLLLGRVLVAARPARRRRAARRAGADGGRRRADGWAAALPRPISTRRSSVAAERLGTAAMPAGPRRRIDPGDHRLARGRAGRSS